MVKARKHGRIVLVIKVNIKMGRKMELEYLNGAMAVVMKVSFH